MTPLSIVRQFKSFQPMEGEFAHSPDLSWYVVRQWSAERYTELLASDSAIQSLAPFGDDSWEALSLSPNMDKRNVLYAKERLTYIADNVCFFPIAILSQGSPIDLQLPCSMSSDEMQVENEQLFKNLSTGHVQLSNAARRGLGSGATDLMPPSTGTSLRDLFEVELSDGSLLIGWAWVWHKK